MSAENELQSLYDEWRRLAEIEGQAIRAGDWPRVADCQAAMQQLQPRIIHYCGELRLENNSAGADAAACHEQLRGTISTLIEIERRNSAWLAEAQQAAQAQFGQLQQTGRTLRQVQRSYAPARRSSWTTFS